MPYQVDDALRHAMSGTELSRVRTELRLLPPEPINQRPLASRGADIVMQSSEPKGLPFDSARPGSHPRMESVSRAFKAWPPA
jgi:hypothetical protein